MCAEHGTNQSLNGKRKPILAPKISFKKNNEEVANVYLTQTAGRKRLTFSGKSFILNLAEDILLKINRDTDLEWTEVHEGVHHRGCSSLWTSFFVVGHMAKDPVDCFLYQDECLHDI